MIEQLLFWVFAILSCGGAIAVVLNQNVVRMAFWLVISLGAVAALFFLLHADFLGAAQLLIYVGGTVVLLVFGVMLTATGVTVRIKASPGDVFLGAGVGLLLLFVLMFTIGAVPWNDLESRLPSSQLSGAVRDAQKLQSVETDGGDEATAKLERSKLEARLQSGRTVRQLGLSFFGLRPDRDLNRPVGTKLSTGYLLPFEIVSIHLLVVLVGAAYLARAKRREVVDSGSEL